MSAVRFHPSSSQGILFPVQPGTSASAYLCILAPSCPLSIISLVARRNTAIVHPKNSFWLSWRICVILNHFDYFSLKWSVSMEDSDCWWACCWLSLTESMLWFSGSRGDHFEQVSIYSFFFFFQFQVQYSLFLYRQSTSMLNKMTAVVPRIYMSRCLLNCSHH